MLVLKYFMQSLGKAHSCLWMSHMQKIRLFLLFQFPVFSCVSENWKPALMVMVSLEVSSAFGQEWKSSWWPHQSELLWSEYERTELKDSVWGKDSVCKGHSVKNIKEKSFFSPSVKIVSFINKWLLLSACFSWIKCLFSTNSSPVQDREPWVPEKCCSLKCEESNQSLFPRAGSSVVLQLSLISAASTFRLY